MNTTTLELTLQILAVGQLAIAVINLRLVPLLGWQSDLARMPLLMREVFYVHKWFISVTLLIFGVLTLRFAEPLATNAGEIFQWLAFAIGGFWAFRTILQVGYYSSSHWKGNVGRTVAHIVLLATYGSFAAAYLWAAFK